MSHRPRIVLALAAAVVLVLGAGIFIGTRVANDGGDPAAPKHRTAAAAPTTHKAPAPAPPRTTVQVTKSRKVNNVPLKPDGDMGSTTRPADPDQFRQRNCDTNIVANSATSCAFADNTFYGYWKSGGSEDLIRVFSPTTKKTYTVSCASDGTLVGCTSSPLSDAIYVSFPVDAVDRYTDSAAASYAAGHQVGESGAVLNLDGGADTTPSDNAPAPSPRDSCASRTHTPQGMCTSDPLYLEMCRDLYNRWKNEDDKDAIVRYGQLDCDQN